MYVYMVFFWYLECYSRHLSQQILKNSGCYRGNFFYYEIHPLIKYTVMHCVNHNSWWKADPNSVAIARICCSYNCPNFDVNCSLKSWPVILMSDRGEQLKWAKIWLDIAIWSQYGPNVAKCQFWKKSKGVQIVFW